MSGDTLPSGAHDPADAEPAYTFIKKLGQGGMAVVFLARKQLPGGKHREVAFKQILPSYTKDPDRVARFLDEMAVAATLDHPNIVGVRHWGTFEGSYFLELELIRGLTLKRLLQKLATPPAAEDEERFGRLPPVLVALIGAQVADALHYAHHLESHHEADGVVGYLHRDVSPDNIMIVAKRGVSKVLDYGISKALKGADREASKTQSAAGKPYYHPPEQWRGGKGVSMDARTDLYALGTTLSLALCGRQLFEPAKDETFEYLVVKVIQGQRPAVADIAPPDAPPALVALIEQLVQADKEKRPESAREVGRALRAIVRELAGDLEVAREQLAALATAHDDGRSDTEKQAEPPRFPEDVAPPSRSTRRPIDPATRPDRPGAPSAGGLARTAPLPAGTTPLVAQAAGPSSPSMASPPDSSSAAGTPAPVASRPLLWVALGIGLTLLAFLAAVAGFVFAGGVEGGDVEGSGAEAADNPTATPSPTPPEHVETAPDTPTPTPGVDSDDPPAEGPRELTTAAEEPGQLDDGPEEESGAQPRPTRPERPRPNRPRLRPEVRPLSPSPARDPSTSSRRSGSTPSTSDLGFGR